MGYYIIAGGIYFFCESEFEPEPALYRLYIRLRAHHDRDLYLKIMRTNDSASVKNGRAKYSYKGLERILHEKARLGIMIALVTKKADAAYFYPVSCEISLAVLFVAFLNNNSSKIIYSVLSVSGLVLIFAGYIYLAFINFFSDAKL